PSPGCLWQRRCQPDDSTKESIAKPPGGLNSIVVVVAASSSVGTASVKTWPALDFATGGLITAWANAALTTTNPAVATRATTSRRDFIVSCIWELSLSRFHSSARKGADRTGGARGGPLAPP